MKLVALISGGFDSPVASYIMAKRGADVILLHMDNGIYGGKKEIKKVKALSKRLEEATGKEFPLYVLNHEANQTLIKKNCDRSYQCVMCKPSTLAATTPACSTLSSSACPSASGRCM